MVLIVIKREDKNRIMRAIMDAEESSQIFGL